MKQNIHKKINRFSASYGYALASVFIMCIFVIYNVSTATDTSGIVLSDNKSELICEQGIHIYKAENADDFLQRLSEYEGMTLKRMICTVNDLYDGSAKDKEAVQLFVDKKLSFWPFRRKDIEEYFLRKTRSNKIKEE